MGIFVCYLAVYISFIFLSKHLDNSDKRVTAWRIMQPFIALAVLVGTFGKIELAFLPGMLIGLLYVYTFPVCYWLTNRLATEKYLFPHDVVFGLYLIVWLACLRYFLSLSSTIIIANAAMSLVDGILLVPIIFQISYFLYYKVCFSESGMQAVLQTNRREAKEFIKGIPLFKLLIPVAVFLLIWSGICVINYNVGLRSLAMRESLVVLSMFVALTVYFFLPWGKGLFYKIMLSTLFLDIKKYQRQLKKSKYESDSLYEQLKCLTTLPPDNFGTILLVIGESANRDHMHAFGNYARETTPWLTACSSSDEFFLLNNSYSSWVQTVTCLSMALTNANQYNNVSINRATSVLDLAHKCKCKTWWYSNQGFVDAQSTPTSILANKAMIHRWTLQDYSNAQFDGILLEYLKKVPSTKDNKFIVLHINGSHAEFMCRYPKEYAKWTVAPNDFVGANPYDNSILYTDHVLSEIFNYVKENLNLQAMVYCSDHGSVIGRKRPPDFTGFEEVRVPAFVYLSEKYQKLYPQTADNLRKHQNMPFTNDLLFDLVGGLLQVDCKVCDKKYDISSAEYNFTADELRTNLGKVALSADMKENRPTYNHDTPTTLRV